MTQFEKDMIHNIEELSELQKELTKALRGKVRKDKLIEEVVDVEIALSNIREHFNISGEQLNKVLREKNEHDKAIIKEMKAMGAINE
jgi:hypothetical protein